MDAISHSDFFSFIGISIHMFHHSSISMPPTIQCIIEGTFMIIIIWNFFCNFVILVLFVNCVKLSLVNNWNPWEFKDGSQHLGVELQPCIHFKNKPNEVRSHEIQTENSSWNLKFWTPIHGWNKWKAFQIIWSKDGLVVSYFPFP
jgi:hypothetical protein